MFNEKPKDKIGLITNDLSQVDTELQVLAEALVNGASFCPAVLVGGKGAANWREQQIFALDIEKGLKIDEAMDIVKNYGLSPCFLYTTFSHTEEAHRFRIIFCNDVPITDGDKRDRLQAVLMSLFYGADPVCKNRNRIFLGSNSHKVLFPDYDARINADDIIGAYWTDECWEHMPTRARKPKPHGKALVMKKTSSEPVGTNVSLIAGLDVEGLREVLEVKRGTDKTNVLNNFDLSGTSLSPRIFESEGALYEHIMRLDLCEYLGVPRGMFCCILPEHDDHDPSANVYTTDTGVQVYKCFGCDQQRTIISITEELAKCKRYEAIEFIKAVYRIDYVPSDWVLNQRQVILDAIKYLGSEDFCHTFPSISKVIGRRKGDLIQILLYCIQYIDEGMQVDGKPIFFASTSQLMKVLGTAKRRKVIQSVALFAILGMLEKVQLTQIPKEELDKATDISRKYGLRKLTTFFAVPEYGFLSLAEREPVAKRLLENHLTIKGLSRDYVLRTFGKDEADRVYPQFHTENSKGTSRASNMRTTMLVELIRDRLAEQGFVYEAELNAFPQWKRSIQEILDTYDLQRIKLSKKLKDNLGIASRGYPYIIIPNEDE